MQVSVPVTKQAVSKFMEAHLESSLTSTIGILFLFSQESFIVDIRLASKYVLGLSYLFLFDLFKVLCRGVFRTLSNICDGAFLQKLVEGFSR